METQYETLLNELQRNRKEIANYQHKHIEIESQFLALQQQNKSLKKTLLQCKLLNQQLSNQIRVIISQKQILIRNFNANVEAIKQEISKKQIEISTLQQNTYSSQTNIKLLEKILKSQCQSEYQQQIETKNQKIKELTNKIDFLNFQASVQKEKYELSIEALKSQLKNIQNSHIIELQSYTQAVSQNFRINQESNEINTMRKLKMQIQELKSIIDITAQQLYETSNQRSQILNEYTSLTFKHKKEVQQYAQQIRSLQNFNKKYSQQSIRIKQESDQFILKQKDKQIKNLKDKIENLYDNISKKEKQISELKGQVVQKSFQIKNLKDFNSKHQTQKIIELKAEKQNLQKQISQLSIENQTIRKQNIQLINSIQETTLQGVKKINEINKNFRDASKKTILTQNNLKKQKSQKQSLAYENTDKKQLIKQKVVNNFGQINRAKSSTNLQIQIGSELKYKNLYEEESRRNQQLCIKFADLKRKYKNLELKFNEANTKLVHLLQDKIQLSSPTAFSKKSFQFNTSPKIQLLAYPQPEFTKNFQQIINNSRNDVEFPGNKRNKMLSDQKIQKEVKQKNIQQNQKREQFYKKSLKVMKSHKFREIKCLNHDDPIQNHRMHCQFYTH